MARTPAPEGSLPLIEVPGAESSLDCPDRSLSPPPSCALCLLPLYTGEIDWRPEACAGHTTGAVAQPRIHASARSRDCEMPGKCEIRALSRRVPAVTPAHNRDLQKPGKHKDFGCVRPRTLFLRNYIKIRMDSAGFEPAAFSLRTKQSTPDLRAQR